MARWLHRTTFALALVISGTATFAQDHGKTTKVLLYKDRLSAQWDTVNCVKNIFKFNPLLFLRGEVPLYYERALSHRLSAELAAGITSRNYLGGSLFGDEGDEFSSGAKILLKPTFRVGFRWYFTDDLEPQGVYVQGEFAYIDHSKDISEKDSTGRFTDATLRDQRLYNDVRLYCGYQRLGATNNWLFDAYGGVALRNRSITKVDERLDLAERSWSYSVTEKHDNVPAFFLGVKVGYGF